MPSSIIHSLILPPLWLSLSAAAAFAVLAWALRLLTPGGAISTFVVGFVIFGLGGGKFAVPLLTFFLTSSLLSKLGKLRTTETPDLKAPLEAKGSTRDAAQVWANGGMAVLMVLLFVWLVSRVPPVLSRNFLVLYLAALATVNADTWATEIGKLSGVRPLSLWSGKTVSPGESGAVSIPGTLAAIAGAVVVPLSALGLWRLTPVEFVIAAWAGFMGSLVDSWLGATVQAQYRLPDSEVLTERTQVDGKPTILARGLPWINNDVVNFVASAVGTGVAWLLLRYVPAL